MPNVEALTRAFRLKPFLFSLDCFASVSAAKYIPPFPTPILFSVPGQLRSCLLLSSSLSSFSSFSRLPHSLFVFSLFPHSLHSIHQLPRFLVITLLSVLPPVT
ncbi:hypothetical protein BKA57DRAFT_210346 [Linnemannia elongata]|nr:hypothetical protein BKA57DRAFT_253585 [Linnemannia elongata]KAH7056674.1 hypothetical protein BKA57DRAFT_210346 [Linnemannia elongata]